MFSQDSGKYLVNSANTHQCVGKRKEENNIKWRAVGCIEPLNIVRN